MPIKHAALKQLRKDAVRNQRNSAAQSRLRTLTKRLVILLKDKHVSEAQTLIREVTKEFDHAASKGIIHRNTAARSKSRLTQRLNALTARPKA